MERDIGLPGDDAPLSEPLLQWWYWTGSLRSADGAIFGVQSCFFEAGMLHGLAQGQMTQVAITDVLARRHVCREYNWLEHAPRTTNCFGLASPDGAQVAAGASMGASLVIDVDGYHAELVTESLTPPVLHYGGAEHEYSFGGNTWYYSRPRLSTVGVIRTPDGRVHAVRGTLWFDRQFGELVPSILRGWQWFGLHLDDGRDVLVFDFPGAPEERYACVVQPDGRALPSLGPATVIEVGATWTSPDTGRVYPAAWRVRVMDLALTVRPLVADQEMTRRCFWIGPKYWEGLCIVEGDARGSGYVELVGDHLPTDAGR